MATPAFGLADADPMCSSMSRAILSYSKDQDDEAPISIVSRENFGNSGNGFLRVQLVRSKKEEEA